MSLQKCTNRVFSSLVFKLGVVWFRANQTFFYSINKSHKKSMERNYINVSYLRSAACAAANLAIGTLNGEQETFVRPILWQNSTEAGSPPCSPQIPISIFLFTFLIELTA